MKEGLGTAGAGEDPFGNAAPPKPSLDLAFKEGQTIRVNLNIDRKRDKPAARTGGINLGASPLLLPPPPGASSVSAIRPASNSVISPINAAPTSNFDLLGGFDSAPVSTGGAPSLTPVDNGDPWGDFTSAPSTMKSGSWEQFWNGIPASVPGLWDEFGEKKTQKQYFLFHVISKVFKIN